MANAGIGGSANKPHELSFEDYNKVISVNQNGIFLFNKYVKGKNNKEFVSLIKELKDDNNFYKKQSKNSKEISEFYSKENILKIWRDFYTKIYNEHKDKAEN